MAQHLHVDPAFPTDATPEEERAGFSAGSIKTPRGTHPSSPWGPPVPDDMAAVVRDLGGGKKAVKVISAVTRKIEYAIYGPNDRPVEPSALSLAELTRRYP